MKILTDLIDKIKRRLNLARDLGELEMLLKQGISQEETIKRINSRRYNQVKK
jgi:hypothetical protein